MINDTTENLLKEALNTNFRSQNMDFDDELFNKLKELVISEKKFEEKLNDLSIIVLVHNIQDDFAELIFDIILFDFFDDNKKHEPNYFESKDWLKIENQILDKGTELFNLLLYLRECTDNDLTISLNDYIDEYLMCEDDFESIETQYYEDIIRNREQLYSNDLNLYVQIAEKNQNGPLEDQLLPILLFFLPDIKPEIKFQAIENHGRNSIFQLTFLKVLTTYKNINNLKHEYINN